MKFFLDETSTCVELIDVEPAAYKLKPDERELYHRHEEHQYHGDNNDDKNNHQTEGQSKDEDVDAILISKIKPVKIKIRNYFCRGYLVDCKFSCVKRRNTLETFHSCNDKFPNFQGLIPPSGGGTQTPVTIEMVVTGIVKVGHLNAYGYYRLGL